jgi:hypothetical protein
MVLAMAVPQCTVVLTNISQITARQVLGNGCSTTYIGLKETKLKNQFSTYTS